MSTKHTPGPWALERVGVQNMIKKNTAIIAMLPPNHVGPGEGFANAKLIVAAPDLLDALIGCCGLLRELGASNGAIRERGLKAIKKATE